MRFRGPANRPSRPNNLHADRRKSTFECENMRRMNEFYASDEGIVAQNSQKIILELDFIDVDIVGTNNVFDGERVIGSQQEMKTSAYVNKLTGEIVALTDKNIGENTYFDNNIIEIELQILIDDPDNCPNPSGNPGQYYAFAAPEPRGSDRIQSLPALLAPRAIENLEATLIDCNQSFNE